MKKTAAGNCFHPACRAGHDLGTYCMVWLELMNAFGSFNGREPSVTCCADVSAPEKIFAGRKTPF